MKRWYIGLLVFALAAALFSAVEVKAANCTNDNQELFAINSITNAHGEVWNGTGNYPVEICYDDYFLSAYPNPFAHNYSGANVVLRLSGLTDAHAEDPKNTTLEYENVSFGDLSCFLRTDNQNCNVTPGNNQYSIIVSLDADTNTHISLTHAYAYALCCKSANGIQPICNYNGICEGPPGGRESPVNCPDCLEGFAECSNGEDDDNDGGCDVDGCYVGEDWLPADFSCSSWQDNDEADPLAQCQNGGDDDLDGEADLLDGECDNWQDDSEDECGNGEIEVGAGEQCEGTNLNGQTCQILGFGSGDGLACDGACRFDPSGCEGYNFCRTYEPFEFQEGEVWLAPSSCQDYNLVYPGEGNVSMRRDLCLNDCVPGASDPVNNGYGGLPLVDWGCGWDNGDKECYFYFNTSTANETCRLDYAILEYCGPDNPFRTVNVTAYPLGGTWACDACGNGQSSCETQIMCPRVIQLPFIGAFGLALAAIIIVLVYICLKRKK